MKKFILLCIATCIGTMANAQINFKIKLLDGLQEQPVKNYTLKLKETKSSTIIEAVTNDEGIATFNNLPTLGKYIAIGCRWPVVTFRKYWKIY